MQSQDPHASYNHDSQREARRTFLKSGAIAGSGLLAAGSIAGRAHAADSETIRVGVVGCGGRGQGALRNALEANPRVRIVALADLFPEPLADAMRNLAADRKYGDRSDVTEESCYDGFDCCDKMLAGSEVDVVLLTAPPHYRPDHLESSINAGKHVFCEKPIATDPTGVRRVRAVCETAEKKGLNIVSGLCWRYDAGVRATVDQVRNGAIGELVTTQADYLTGPVSTKARRPTDTDMEYQCRNWYYFNWLSGDHVVEQFIHSLDKALWIRGDVPPVKAYGTGGRQLRSDLTQGNIYDHFSIVYEWADGTRTFATTRQYRNCMSQTEDFIFGSQGSAKLLAHVIDGPRPWQFEGDSVNMYVQEHIELYDAILGNRPTINNGGYMCDSTLLAILGREVCYSGQEITWDEVAHSPQDLRPEQYDFAGAAPPVHVPQPGKYRFPVA